MVIIGVAGGSGSGKSTIVNRIYELFSDAVCIIRHDDYYKALHNLDLEERTRQNFDCPDAYDTALLVEHLNLLKNGKSINRPVYDYTIYDRVDETVEVKPCKVLLIDGVLALAEPKLRDLMDVKIFVDTDADIRLLRRIKRDMKKRGRSLESITKQYNETVKPMHELYVEPSKKHADIIIPEGGRNEVAMSMLESKIKEYIEN